MMKKIEEYNFINKELLSALLNLPNNKNYKREKIRNVSVVEDKEKEIYIRVDTRFYTYSITIFIENNKDLYICGSIDYTAYDDVDNLLVNWYDEGTIGEFSVTLENSISTEQIVDEIIYQMSQDEWISRFKLLNKVYNSLENFRDSALENNIEEIFEEMIRIYAAP